MTDPFDSLRRDRGFTAPDPRFRTDLLARLEHALVMDEPTIDPPFHPTFEPMEITMPADHRPSRTRLAFIGGGIAAAIVLLVALVALRDDDSTEPASDSTELAASSTSTSPPSTAAPTTTVAALTDAEIAEAGFLTTAEIGGGYAPIPSATFVFDLRTPGGPGAEDPACEPFLPTVFESDARPATVRVKGYQAPGAGQQMYVVVFPDQTGAEAMMVSVADPAFPACMAAVVSAAYSQSDTDVVTNRTPLVAQPPRPLTPVGDEMTVLAFKGSYDLGGTTWTDEGLIPFVRVGRAVFWMNPNSARTPANTDGYPDAQLQAALEIATQHLRDAQSR
jgi:hypothetical protein